MMSELSVKIKVGENTFEATGPADAVQIQVQAFARMIGSLSLETPPPIETSPPIKEELKPSSVSEKLELDRIMQISERTVSLRVAPKVDDAVLLILLGQRHYRRDEAVAGSDIMNGLRDSDLEVLRVDSNLKRHAASGMVVATGRRRLRRYRLSTDGLNRAEKIARELISQNPASVRKAAAAT